MSVSFVGSLVVIICVVVASVGGLLIVRRLIAATSLRSHHDVTDPLLQVVGMMFAILLGFMVSDAMQRFEQARMTAQQEAGSLADIFRLAEGLPEENRDHLRQLCVTYTDEVIQIEWPLLVRKKTSNITWKTYAALWSECVTYQPKTEAQTNLQQSLLTAMATLGESRNERVESLGSGLPFVLWVVLAISGFATVLFTYFFGVDNTKMQAVMTAIVTLVICLNIFLLAAYDNPFAGDVMLQPIPFEVDAKTFDMTLHPSKMYEDSTVF
jgi:hypothetical protein